MSSVCSASGSGRRSPVTGEWCSSVASLASARRRWSRRSPRMSAPPFASASGAATHSSRPARSARSSRSRRARHRGQRGPRRSRACVRRRPQGIRTDGDRHRGRALGRRGDDRGAGDARHGAPSTSRCCSSSPIARTRSPRTIRCGWCSATSPRRPARRGWRSDRCRSRRCAPWPVPEGASAEELYQRTGGNPFYVTEALAEPGTAVPTTVRLAVLARASRLPHIGPRLGRRGVGGSRTGRDVAHRRDVRTVVRRRRPLRRSRRVGRRARARSRSGTRSPDWPSRPSSAKDSGASSTAVSSPR